MKLYDIFGVAIQTAGAAVASLFPVFIAIIVPPHSFKMFSEAFFLTNLAALLSCPGVDQLLVRRGTPRKTSFAVFALLALTASAIIAYLDRKHGGIGVAWVAVGSLSINFGNYLQTWLLFEGRGRATHAYTTMRVIALALAVAAGACFRAASDHLFVIWCIAQAAPIPLCVTLLAGPSRRVKSNGGGGAAVGMMQSVIFFFVFSAAGIVLSVERVVAAHLLSAAALKRYMIATFSLSVLIYAGVGIERHLTASIEPGSRQKARNWLAFALSIYAPVVGVLLLVLYRGSGLGFDPEIRSSFTANIVVLALGGAHVYLYFSVAPEVFRMVDHQTMVLLAKVGAATAVCAGLIFMLRDRAVGLAGLPGVMLVLYTSLLAGSFFRYIAVRRGVLQEVSGWISR